MRILFLGEPDSPNTISWVEGLRDQGCEVFLASARTDGADGNIPIGSPKLPARLRILTGVKHLKHLIKDIKPDILIAYRITSYGYLAARTGFHPLVIAAQNEQIVYLPKPSFWRSRFLGRCAKIAIQQADLIHSWGQNITEGLVEFKADPKKILTLHRGIDMTPFIGAERGGPRSEVRDQRTEDGGNKQTAPLPHSTIALPNCGPTDSPTHETSALKNSRTSELLYPVFISTRSLAPEYEIEKILHAFKSVLEKIPGAKLEIVGSGTEEVGLKKLAEDLDLTGNVTFHGRVNKKKVVKLLLKADFYVSIIQTEGISSSLIEAIASGGVPIVADMPASRGLIRNNTNGLLVTRNNPEVLAAVMLQAVDSLENMKSALEENRKTIISSFNRETNQKVFLEKYKELLP